MITINFLHKPPQRILYKFEILFFISNGENSIFIIVTNFDIALFFENFNLYMIIHGSFLTSVNSVPTEFIFESVSLMKYQPYTNF